MRITVKDAAKFSLDEVKSILGSRYNDGVKVLVGPTPAAAAPAPPSAK